MPIIFPDRLKGTTAGALREIKQQGFTTACGGLYSLDYIDNSLAKGNLALYANKNEPLGVFMTQGQKIVNEVNEIAEAVHAATHAMVEAAKESNKQMAEVSGKMRDNAEKLSAAISKFSKVAGDSHFAEKARVAESLVNSLERLAELEKSGMLDKIMKAMAKTA